MSKGIVITVVVVIVVLGLFIWGKQAQKDNIVYFGDTEVACLTRGHQQLAEHIHPILNITIDGVPEVIPANVGITPSCMSEVHTHDETGTLHVESFEAGRIGNFDLSHFFDVWGRSVEREGYDLAVVQDGVIKNAVEEVSFIDHSVIELRYISQNLILLKE